MRKLITLLEMFVLFLLQTTFFPRLTFLSVVPNLLLILTVTHGFINGKKSGLFTGFFCGLLIDIFYSNLFGFYSLVYMYIGYMTGLLYNVYYDDDVKVPMVLVAISDLVYGCLIWGHAVSSAWSNPFSVLPQPHHHSRGRTDNTDDTFAVQDFVCLGPQIF